jgi:hypothetical protein
LRRWALRLCGQFLRLKLDSAAACSGRSVSASPPSASGSARSVWPMSSTSTPRRVSILMSRVMTGSPVVLADDGLGIGVAGCEGARRARRGRRPTPLVVHAIAIC